MRADFGFLGEVSSFVEEYINMFYVIQQLDRDKIYPDPCFVLHCVALGTFLDSLCLTFLIQRQQ